MADRSATPAACVAQRVDEINRVHSNVTVKIKVARRPALQIVVRTSTQGGKITVLGCTFIEQDIFIPNLSVLLAKIS
jgi:hypothetical protein